MLVFITNPKYFDKAKLNNKSVDLIYIFNSNKLYQELSKNYKCVNLDNNYKIKDENFFPKEAYKNKNLIDSIFYFRMKILTYYYKTRYATIKKTQGYTTHSYKRDPIYQLTISNAKKIFKKDPNEALNIINKAIYTVLVDIIELSIDKSYVKTNKDFFSKIFALSDTFHRSYIYSFKGLKRGAEITADILKFNYALNCIKYYRFDRYDIYEDRFHYNYLKVLSRLFIEHIHRNLEIKEFTYQNIEYWQKDR